MKPGFCIFLLCLACSGCYRTTHRDATDHRDVREIGFVGRRFVVVKDLPVVIASREAYEEAGGRWDAPSGYVVQGYPAGTLAAGTELRIVQVKYHSWEPVYSQYSAFAEVMSGLRAGVSDLFRLGDANRWPTFSWTPRPGIVRAVENPGGGGGGRGGS